MKAELRYLRNFAIFLAAFLSIFGAAFQITRAGQLGAGMFVVVFFTLAAVALFVGWLAVSLLPHRGAPKRTAPTPPARIAPFFLAVLLVGMVAIDFIGKLDETRSGEMHAPMPLMTSAILLIYSAVWWGLDLWKRFRPAAAVPSSGR